MGKEKIEFRCAIYIGKYGINIFSNYPKMFEALREGSPVFLIPEYRCSNVKARSDYRIIYTKNRQRSAKLLDGHKTLEIQGPLQDVVEAATIPFRAHYMLEQQLEQHSIFTTQGSGVSKEGRGIFLMGKRGAGKSSITLELCRKYQYKLVGNDMVLVAFRKNVGYFYGGAKVFTLRRTAVKYYNTDLQKLFPPLDQTEWLNKIRLFPKDSGISVEPGHPKIVGAYYVHLLNSQSAPLYVRRIRDNEFPNMGRLYLYEELSSYIRGICTPVVYGSRLNIGDYLPSLDMPLCHRNRVRLINWVMDRLGFYFISGSMDSICHHINTTIASPN